MVEIAVVVTSYGLGRTLDEALASVRAQSLTPRELVVVDDGSTDSYTKDVLARLESDGTRVVRTPNRGLSAARNLGARLTGGDALVFLDGDDRLVPRYLELAAARLAADADLGYVTSGLRGFGASDYTWTPPPLDLAAWSSGAVPHVSSLLRRDTFTAAGGFDEALRSYEDLDLWLTFLERGVRGEVLPAPLLEYRTRAGSLARESLRRTVRVPAMRHIFAKHREYLATSALPLLAAKRTLLLEQRKHERHLVDLRRQREAELDRLRATAARLAADVRRRGGEPLSWGDLAGMRPLSEHWGVERGRPVDRVYIEDFLARHQEDIAGRALEVKDDYYCMRFGGARVRVQHVLDVDQANPRATIVADLARADAVPAESFDCIVLTQTLGLVFDARGAITHLHRMLAPGGVLLLTVGGLGRLSMEDRGLDGDYWRFTEASLRELLHERFPPGSFTLEAHGNVKVATAFLHGLAAHELPPEAYAEDDAYFPVVYCVRAVKAAAPPPAVGARTAEISFTGGAAEGGGIVLAYHRVADREPDPLGLTTDCRTFAAHMEMIRRELQPLPLDELVDAARAGVARDGAVAVTFDDGTLDTLLDAAPILGTWGVPATHFVLSVGLDDAQEPWWDELARLLLVEPTLSPRLDVRAAGDTLTLATANASERRASWARLHALLLRAPLDERDAALATVRAACPGAARYRESHRLLLADEVRALARRPGQRIGAHSERHPWLPAEGPDVRRREIAGSATRLAAIVGLAVEAFAYPYGAYDEATVVAVRAAGLRHAFTVDAARVRPDTDALRLPRLVADGLAVDELRARVRSLQAAPELAP